MSIKTPQITEMLNKRSYGTYDTIKNTKDLLIMKYTTPNIVVISQTSNKKRLDEIMGIVGAYPGSKVTLIVPDISTTNRMLIPDIEIVLNEYIMDPTISVYTGNPKRAVSLDRELSEGIRSPTGKERVHLRPVIWTIDAVLSYYGIDGGDIRAEALDPSGMIEPPCIRRVQKGKIWPVESLNIRYPK